MSALWVLMYYNAFSQSDLAKELSESISTVTLVTVDGQQHFIKSRSYIQEKINYAEIYVLAEAGSLALGEEDSYYKEWQKK